MSEIPPPATTPSFDTPDWYAVPKLYYTRLYADSPYLDTPKEGDAGYDIRAYLPNGPLDILPDTLYRISTGLAIAIPRGHVGLVWARSGLTFEQHFITWGAGVVDSNYRGEVWLSMYSLDQEFTIHSGDRIAQVLIVPYLTMPTQEVPFLDVTVRGAKGIGSSGVK